MGRNSTRQKLYTITKKGYSVPCVSEVIFRLMIFVGVEKAKVGNYSLYLLALDFFGRAPSINEGCLIILCAIGISLQIVVYKCESYHIYSD